MMNKKILKSIAKLGYNSAIRAGGTASQFGIYQPVEPKVIFEIRRKSAK